MESMASGGRSETAGEEEGQIPLDIDNVHLLLQVEQEQIQKRTFTNWINAQLAKHRPPTVVLDLFTDVRDGNRLLDLLEVISGQPMSRERGRSIFQCRANIETALTFLRRKSIKLVNINIPDIIEGKPSIVLGLIWTIILHFHIEELANSLAFSSRQSSMESLASIDSCSTIDSSSSRRSGTLHTKFKLSAKKALLLWAREQCQKNEIQDIFAMAGANISIKDFKSSWRSGLAFLAILNSLRPNLVDLQKTKSRTNRENLEEAFRTAEHELKIPRLLEPEDVDINDPDDKSIMTYVAQFLQYSKDLPVSEEEMQQLYVTSPQTPSPVRLSPRLTQAISSPNLQKGNLNQKVKGVTSWLTQAEQELEGSIGEADKESYEEKFHAFQTFVTTFNEQKRPIMPLLTAMRKTTQLTEDQVRLKEAWNKVTSKIREYKVALDLDLPSPLDGVGVWLQKIEPVLGEEIAKSQDHEEVAGRIRDTLHLLKSLMEEMDVHWQTLQKFPNKDKNGATRVPQEKMDELKRRFTSARVTAKYHGIKLEYQESKHSVQALICAVNSKLNTWKKKYGTKESVKLLQLDWSEFILKLSLLKEQWQGAIRRAQQRKGVIEGLVRQWHHYQDSLKKLKTFLSDTANHLDLSNSQAHHGLHQTRREVEDIKHKEMLFQRHRCSYILTLETGKQIFSMANPETETLLQEELCELQESWEHTETLLKEKQQLMNTSLESWENCENKINEFGRRLQDIKIKVSDPPQVHEELQATEKQTKVSLRKQEIADRLNAWIIFNEKNKELCEWLTEMENKVSHNAELSIEEMVEKLKKDCMEEINLFSENKTHLKILGEQLLNASNKTKETEINDKLKDINDRWQHLFDHIEARVKKLKETQVTVQQLDKNMSNLRTWLSHIEAELSKPVVYNICDNEEIQKKLSEQQDLQRDIEQHTDGVASVINLCDVLLHDSDACATETECDSIQQTTASLDRRWRNICAMSMERRMKIEETCRLWSKFLDDYSRFEDWLKTAERTAACPNSAEVLYTSAKEELKKFETFQRQVHERLTQLELVNKQYRRLARENRTDTASRLKLMVHEGNQRWDNLQKRVAAILRRLKYFTSQREEFEGTRDGILVWLTEMDLQLTNVEHFSESDIEDKMRQLDGFQQEITLNTNKIDQLIVFGENLIQKSQPLDAVLIEDELEELHSYCQEVFGRVARFHHRLINKGPVSEDEKESSDRDTDLEDSAELQGIGWQEKMGHEVSPSCQSMCQLMPPTPGQERSGRETPISVDSIPLEWDHTVDVGSSSSHEDEEEPVYYSALSDVEIAENPESFVKMTSKTLKATSVKSPSEPPSWHSPDHQDSRKQRIQTEIIRNLSSTSPTTSTPYKMGYVKLMSECSGSIDSVKRVKLILNDEEQLEEQGLVGLTTAEKQSGVIERWELIQAQGLSNKLRKKQNLQQWQQLNSDLHDITSWMKQIEPELDELQKLESSTSIQDIEGNIKKLKEIQKAFDNYKSVVISLNLISKDFQQVDSDESQELHGRLGLMNQSWVQACNKLDCWKEGLQTALMQCQDFHETTHDLLLWLAHAVSRRYTVDLTDSNIKSCVLQEHQKTLMQLEGDLLEKQLQVSSLQEISTHLLVKADEEDHIEAKEKVHVIENKLKLVLREVSQDMQTIQKKLDTCSSFASLDEVDCSDIAMTSTPLSQIKEASEEKITATKASTNTRPGRRESSPPRSFFYRVLRAAFPLQVLFLLLLVLACLVPLTEEDYSCSLSNNFARSFYPMLRYTNGPPPT